MAWGKGWPDDAGSTQPWNGGAVVVVGGGAVVVGATVDDAGAAGLVLGAGVVDHLGPGERRARGHEGGGADQQRQSATHPELDAQSRPMKRMASVRVATFSRNRPRTAEVTVVDPGFFTPRMDMQRCSASIDHQHAAGLQGPLDLVGDLGGQPLLDLGPAGVGVDQAGQLRQAGDAAVVVGDVGHVGLAR